MEYITCSYFIGIRGFFIQDSKIKYEDYFSFINSKKGIMTLQLN